MNPVTDKIYVANDSSGTVTVIDGATNVTATVTVGAYPNCVAVNPATNKIYVANSGANDVTVIDGVTNATTTVPVGNWPRFVAVNPVTNKIYVANSSSNDVTVIDGVTHATATVAVSSAPMHVAVNPVANRVYVVNNLGVSVTVIDGATNATTTVAVGTAPQSVEVNPVTSKAYVANWFGSNVTVIDGVTNAKTTVAVGTNPSHVAINPVTNKIYVANAESVTALTEQTVSAIPLVTTIAPLAGDVSISATPTFTLTALSTFAPTAPPVQGVFTQVDTWQGAWQAATPSGGDYLATTSPLGFGTHILYAYAVDGQYANGGCTSANGSVCSPLLGSIAAYVFTVVPSAADVSVTKTDGVSSQVPGTSASYTIVASNAGPSPAPSVTVVDAFPASCTGATWTCAGAGGGTCAASGSGDIYDVASLPVGGLRRIRPPA